MGLDGLQEHHLMARVVDVSTFFAVLIHYYFLVVDSKGAFSFSK